mmetsp:Transcript_39324/g.111184  ORF Transcript_39324/g.111184 Transcript_39324/m.111184 type:complete len:224 (-) Transcript_39324:93-764(-)
MRAGRPGAGRVLRREHDAGDGGPPAQPGRRAGRGGVLPRPLGRPGRLRGRGRRPAGEAAGQVQGQGDLPHLEFRRQHPGRAGGPGQPGHRAEGLRVEERLPLRGLRRPAARSHARGAAGGDGAASGGVPDDLRRHGSVPPAEAGREGAARPLGNGHGPRRVRVRAGGGRPLLQEGAVGLEAAPWKRRLDQRLVRRGEVPQRPVALGCGPEWSPSDSSASHVVQ